MKNRHERHAKDTAERKSCSTVTLKTEEGNLRGFAVFRATKSEADRLSFRRIVHRR
ncbi:MAG: hypothetical protein ABSF87_13710 [Xanthobacteraceae bacterium]|jgi:hypothetical protein